MARADSDGGPGAGCIAGPGWGLRGRSGRPRPARATSGRFVRYSDLRPDRPFDPVAAGLLASTVFSEHTASGQRIEVRELLVGPKQATVRHVLPAAALLAGKAMAIRVTTEMATKETTSVPKP